METAKFARRDLVRDAFFPGKEAGKKYVASGLSFALVKARHEVNGCSWSRMDAFDFSNFKNSIFFIGRDLQKAQCMFVWAIEWNEDWFGTIGWNVSFYSCTYLKLRGGSFGRIFLNEAWKQLEGCMFTCTQMEMREANLLIACCTPSRASTSSDLFVTELCRYLS